MNVTGFIVLLQFFLNNTILILNPFCILELLKMECFMKIGIIKEGKVPPDTRVALNPMQCKYAKDNYPIDIVIQSSPTRCFTDKEYLEEGIQIQENLHDCDLLLGVKEVPIPQLIDEKIYFFFSHTIKEQVYNKSLLQSILQKNIQLIDYEVLTNEKKQRLIAFGKFAGMVGAHNALYTYAQRTGQFSMQRMHQYYDYKAAKASYTTINWPPVKIVLTGMGRVAGGAAQVLKDMGIQQVSPKTFLTKNIHQASFCQLDCHDYAAHRKGKSFELAHFFKYPQDYNSIFKPYTQVADIMINGIYWDNQAPAFFTIKDMQSDDFNIQVIADVTCDIAPVSSIPSTLRASTIADPIFGFDPITGKETLPHQVDGIDMMTIDNLPNELPRDASTAFGIQFIKYILPELSNFKESRIIERATVAVEGNLGKHFGYLKGFVGQ